MNRIAAAAEKVERLEPRLAEARQELHAAVRDAHCEGASLGTISRVAGLSRERLRQIVSREWGEEGYQEGYQTAGSGAVRRMVARAARAARLNPYLTPRNGT